MTQQGLYATQGPAVISLKYTDVYVHIVDDCVEVNFKQHYVNIGDSPVEAVYKLTLPRYTVVSGFVITSEGRKIRAIIKDLEIASDEYSDAISSGHRAYLVERSSKQDVNEFTINIANLAPQKDILVDISFLSQISSEGRGKQFFRLPVELLPKQGEVIFTCDVFSSSVIKRLEATPNAKVENDKVFWKGNASALNSDIVVTIVTEDKEPYAIVETDLENTNLQAVMITLYPTSECNELFEPQFEFVFVVDRSGSMSGSSMDYTKKALHILLHALPSESKFNIVGFGTSTDYLFPESVKYTAENLATAKKHCENISANLGGTDLLKPLRGIFSKPVDPVYPRVIFVLTDGEVDDRAGTIAEVKRSIEGGRLYAIGIGSSVDRQLVQGMAEAGRGACEFVQRSDGIEKAVMGLFQNTLIEQYSSFTVSWPSKAYQTPHIVPTSESNQRIVIYSLLENGNMGDTIDVTAKGPNGPVSWNIKATHKKGNTIQRLIAFSLIRDLQEGRSSFHFTEAGQKVDLPESKIKAEIIRLGIKYQLSSKYTSFIAVEELDIATTSSMQTIGIDTKTPSFDDKSIMNQISSQLKMKREEEERRMKEVEEKRIEASVNRAAVIECIDDNFTFCGVAEDEEYYGCEEEDAAFSDFTFTMPSAKMEEIADCFPEADPEPCCLSQEEEFIRLPVRESLSQDIHLSTVQQQIPQRTVQKSFVPQIPQSIAQQSFVPQIPQSSVQKIPQSSAQQIPQSIAQQCFVPQSTVQPKVASYEQLVGKQQFTGSWNVQSIAQVANVTPQQVLRAKPDDVSEDVWATAYGISLLEALFGASKSIWGMVAKKARVYIVKELSKQGIDTRTATDKAEEIIKLATQQVK